MPLTVQQTQLAETIDTHVRQVLAHGGGDEGLRQRFVRYPHTSHSTGVVCRGVFSKPWCPSPLEALAYQAREPSARRVYLSLLLSTASESPALLPSLLNSHLSSAFGVYVCISHESLP
jgi:hypothetical protein